ncbi:glycosyltransferase [Microbacterium pygmaeum]|uniref:UDP-N-acetylglucosamine:LPS N-acetylglucosamine transferase n=1 Tax=Microbacterium pygmaeum TaxID=370764 RepID=A0A1G8E147_9MICO|nr:glycosyltransferase [Microbacterium pygmaeum]SDH63643.1 UDP-N-acetylglucosamine:LPS N-acetylglucosamine transferase [Microbacterium pygmaeum]
MTDDGDVLLVCSGGGHLRQLAGFAERMGIAPERQVWVTFRNGLSESLLEGRRVIYAPFTAPRDLRNFAKMLPLARKVLAENTFVQAISTGSSPAVAFLPLAARKGIPTFYIESAARADGPSMTGKIISRVKRIQTFCQYPAWADDRWQYRGSVFDSFAPGEVSDRTPRRAVVSVGTQEGYPFTRLFDKVVPLLADFDEVLYQTGDADVSHLGIEGVVSMPHDDLKAAIARADVVITHAGVGGALTALSLGKHPIMIPRTKEHGEHIDDHQVQVARELDRRELATLRQVDDLTAEDIVFASRQSVRTVQPPAFHLTPVMERHG